MAATVHVDASSGGEPPGDGIVRNTALQFASQIAGVIFTGGLGIFLVRYLGSSRYGVYALAVSIVSVALYPAGLGLPYAVGRYLADHRRDVAQLRAIFRVGLRLQVAAGLVVTIVLFAAAGPLAAVFHKPGLAWPLRWVSLSIVGQSVFTYVSSAVAAMRRVVISLQTSIVESVAEAGVSAGLVVAGGGAAGAVLGKTAGYTVASLLGVLLVARLLGVRRGVRPARLAIRLPEMLRYSAAMLVVDVAWSAISQIDTVLIGALLALSAVGSFSAVLRILTLLAYPGLAVAAGVAPRLSRADGDPDVRAFVQSIRFLIIVQAATLAPLLVWTHPIVDLVLGSGYHSAPAILRVLTVQAFVSAPNALVSVAVTYLGEARRRLKIVLVTLAVGIAITYVLIRLVGVVGAAIGDDVVQVVYLAANLGIAARLVDIDFGLLLRSLLRSLLAAADMALPLVAFGQHDLSPLTWVAGLAAGLAVYVVALVGSGEVSPRELGAAVGWLGSRLTASRAGP